MRSGATLLLVSVLVLPAAIQAQTYPVPGASDAGNHAKDKIRPLDITVNGTKSGTWLLLERDGELFAPSDAFFKWHVLLPHDAKPIDYKLDKETYWSLSSIPGFKITIDTINQSAELSFSPEVFSTNRFTQETVKRPEVSPVLPSMFLNYDLSYLNSSQSGLPLSSDLGAITEIGVSNSLGVLTSSQTGRNMTNDAIAVTPHGWVRLETTFTKDLLDTNRTLKLGDSTTRSSMWGRSVYFGGIQIGSNFALTPGFMSQPVPMLSGIATVPSTVQMYVNNVLRQVSNVPTGPFVIDNSPLLTGSGDVRIVTQDVLGRQTVTEQSFFTSTELIAHGIDDWSAEGGSVRRDLTVASANYGPFFASGTWRHGYSDKMTLEGHAEAQPHVGTLGFGMVLSLQSQVLGKAAIAASKGDNQSGDLLMLGVEHQSLKQSFSAQVQYQTLNFHQLGQDLSISPTRLQFALDWNYTTKKTDSYGIGLATIRKYNDTNLSTMSGNYSTHVGEHGNLTFSISHGINGISATTASIYFVMPLDNSKVITATASRQNSYVSAMETPGNQNGFGWRALSGSVQGQSHDEAGVNYQGRYGQVTGDASASPGQSSFRLGATGGVVIADNSIFFTQKVDQSFAVAEIADYDNIGIGLGCNMLTHTNDSGVALIPRLMAYQSNNIRLDPGDLPVSAELDSIEQNVVPAWRSAVKAVFPVRGGRGALLKVMLDDGDVAPAGAVANIEGDSEIFYVARRGEVFVTGLKASNRVVLNWNEQHCLMDVTLPAKSPDDIPRIGPLVCKGVTR